MHLVKAQPVPTDLAEHLARHWPTRKVASDCLVLNIEEMRDAPQWLVSRVELDLRTRLASGLMRDHWVMISMASPEWYVRPTGLEASLDDREAEFPWDPADTDKLNDLEPRAVVVCRVTGHAVPSFLEPTGW